MRATKDDAMSGPENIQAKLKVLESVIADQRKILTTQINQPAEQIPQVFCPYKEVLTLYQAGLKVPDDVMITWVDDNHGNIRQLPNPAEQKNSGGNGVYYHFSYWGTPEDYLWLSSVSPSLMAYELNKAYAFNARKMWVYNVGDLKPAEMETQFGMDLAWNIKKWPATNAHNYAYSWATETFGAAYAKQIAAIKASYYRLAAAGKPEHADKVNYTPAEVVQRMKDYQQLDADAEALVSKIPDRLKDAYYQLILYPVKGSRLMNEKIFYARKSLQLANEGNTEALVYSKKAQDAYNEIQSLTKKYNDTIAVGKWHGMMDARPRNAKVYSMPPVATSEMVKEIKTTAHITGNKKQIIAAADYNTKRNATGTDIKTIEGLGMNGRGVSVSPFIAKSYSKEEALNAPYLSYKVKLQAGNNKITVKCLPTFRIYGGLSLRYGITINDQPMQVQELTSLAETGPWGDNVLRGYNQGVSTFNINATGETIICIYFLDPGLVVNQIEIESK